MTSFLVIYGTGEGRTVKSADGITGNLTLVLRVVLLVIFIRAASDSVKL